MKKMNRKISISMMCIDFGNLNSILKCFEEETVDYLHIDVMDGHFVPNLMLGTSFVNWLRKATDIPLDFHFMVDSPVEMMKYFQICSNDLVTVHVESGWNTLGALMYVKKQGAKATLAISPQTPVSSIKYLFPYIDGVCVMLVIPGFSGQTMIEGMIDKVKELSDYRKKNNMNFLIEVDGYVNETTVRSLEAAGADIYVLGTSMLGKNSEFYRDKIRNFCEA